MVFGKIEYLNLLPFHVYMKRFLRYSAYKTGMEYYKNVPSAINKKFALRRVDGAFISSVAAKGCRGAKLAIIANKEVQSVLVVPAASPKKDKASATSNKLAEVLDVNGEVLIGDKALEYYLKKKPFTDLAKLWYERYHLPFVFATLCFHKRNRLSATIEKNFGKYPTKIPRYILLRAAKQTNIPPQAILEYLTCISYTMDYKSKKSLAKFLAKAK